MNGEMLHSASGICGPAHSACSTSEEVARHPWTFGNEAVCIICDERLVDPAPDE